MRLKRRNMHMHASYWLQHGWFQRMFWTRRQDADSYETIWRLFFGLQSCTWGSKCSDEFKKQQRQSVCNSLALFRGELISIADFEQEMKMQSSRMQTYRFRVLFHEILQVSQTVGLLALLQAIFFCCKLSQPPLQIEQNHTFDTICIELWSGNANQPYHIVNLCFISNILINGP